MSPPNPRSLGCGLPARSIGTGELLLLFVAVLAAAIAAAVEGESGRAYIARERLRMALPGPEESASAEKTGAVPAAPAVLNPRKLPDRLSGCCCGCWDWDWERGWDCKKDDPCCW